MNLFEAVILGIVQGLTEFLPVSSSGHLVIMQSLFKNFSQVGISFDIFIHLATLSSIFVYFNKQIIEILKLKNKKWAYLIIIGTIPAGVIGILFKQEIEKIFSNVTLVSLTLIITGILLFISDKVTIHKKNKEDISYTDAIIIGIFQALAILPGISRSGSTISAAIFKGIDRAIATEFSFLLSIPAILGAVVLSLKDFTQIPSSYILPYISGFISAFITGLLSLKLLTVIIKSKNLKYFSFYCWGLSVFIFIYF